MLKPTILRLLTALAALLGLANPLIAFAAVDFNIAQSIADPMIYVKAVSSPFWIWLGMPLFFLTDSFGWYILPTYLIRRVAALPGIRAPGRLVILTWAYTIMGNIGVLIYATGYYRYIAGAPATTFVQLSRLSYDWIWGSLNNIVGAAMFFTLALALRRRSHWIVALLLIVVGVMMLLSSLLFVSGVVAQRSAISDLSSAITMPIYILAFPFAILSLWAVWQPKRAAQY